jgi:hypothetical protein
MGRDTMLRICYTCGKEASVYLHKGKLYCRHHVPSEELDLPARAEWLVRRAQLNREDYMRRLEALRGKRIG